MGLNLGSGIYGLITAGTLLAAETARSETYPETILGVALAATLYWLAHAYGEFASWRVLEGKRLTSADLRRALWRELPVLLAAVLPLLTVVAAWIVGADLSAGVTAGIWAVAIALVLIEIVAGVRARLSGRELLLQTVMGAILGLIVLALRLVLH